jgi:hypothetical protein
MPMNREQLIHSEKQLPERAESQDLKPNALINQELEIITGGSVRKAAREGAVGGLVIGAGAGTVGGVALGAKSAGLPGAVLGGVAGHLAGMVVGAGGGAASRATGAAILKKRGK